MPYNPNFNLDAVLETLGTVNNGFTEGSPEDEALRIAAVALLYVRDIQKLEEYRDYFQRFFTHRPVVAAHVFPTRADADAWLGSGKARDGELVSIAGQGFTVIQALHELKFIRTPLPEELSR
ncbi:hypothetical protein F0U62_10855 [Cystobacter fuscus]|uniref:hypothetical protein n=1 Tax=Cystobacter fuscus TaxID=43 RepID=UPI002B2E7378|nr:hypothetical protein F0U62_10855 [Cystobacter fuscus]